MTVHPIPVKLTYSDYLEFPRDLKRHEIVAGEHHVSASPIPYHQMVVIRLVLQLHPQIEGKGLGVVLTAPVCVHLGEHDIVEPDVVVLLQDRKHMLTPTKIKGAPSLVIEVLSPSTSRYDRVTKRACYARCGVPEYWIVNLDDHAVEQLVLEEAEYGLRVTCSERIAPSALPEAAVDLTRVW